KPRPCAPGGSARALGHPLRSPGSVRIWDRPAVSGWLGPSRPRRRAGRAGLRGRRGQFRDCRRRPFRPPAAAPPSPPSAAESPPPGRLGASGLVPPHLDAGGDALNALPRQPVGPLEWAGAKRTNGIARVGQLDKNEAITSPPQRRHDVRIMSAVLGEDEPG